MEEAIDEIKRKMDVVNYIGEYVTLHKTGRNFKGLCPFHSEKSPSFVISPDRQIWHCFGACQEGGDVITFYMKMEQVNFVEAVRDLAEKLGIKIKSMKIDNNLTHKKEKLIKINMFAKDYFSYVLNTSSVGHKALVYLSDRKINKQVIQKFELGYAPSSWESLRNYLHKKKYSDEEIYEAGLLVKSEGGKYYDRFRGRIIFPIKDSRGTVIGFSGRILDNDEKSAKYINSPETLLYRKRESLYGIHLAKDAIKKTQNVLLVEGEFDVISPYQIGIENVVAIKGSAVTKEQLTLLKRYTKRIIFALDADNAGEEAIKRGIEEAENLELEIEIVSIENGKDPDEAARTHPSEFKKLIERPIPIYDFIIQFFQKKYPGDDLFSKKNIAESVAPFILTIQNPIVRSYCVKKLAHLLDVDEQSVISLLSKTVSKKRRKFIDPILPIEQHEQKREILLEKYLLSLLFQDENPYIVYEEIITILQKEDFIQPSLGKILKYFEEYKKDNAVYNTEKFMKILPKELQPVFDELYLYASIEIGFEKIHIRRLTNEIKKHCIKRTIKELSKSPDKQSEDTEQKLLKLNTELKELEKTSLQLYN